MYAALGRLETAAANALQPLAFLAQVLFARFVSGRKQVLVLACEDGRETTGFFDQLAVLLGLLEYFEKWGGAFAGVRVDYADRGLYFDPAVGANSWEYHFQPIDPGQVSGAVERKIDVRLEDSFATRGENMPRLRAFELISAHIRVKPHVREKVEAFAIANFGQCSVIGVHYRGTDKWKEARRVPYEEVSAATRDAIRGFGTDDYRLFVASDEQAFVDYMENAFPGRVRSWETRRSRDLNGPDSEPIDARMEDNYKKGEDAVVDCILLSRCHLLIRTQSCLGLFSGYFNPSVPVTLLNQYY